MAATFFGRKVGFENFWFEKKGSLSSFDASTRLFLTNSFPSKLNLIKIPLNLAFSSDLKTKETKNKLTRWLENQIDRSNPTLKKNLKIESQTRWSSMTHFIWYHKTKNEKLTEKLGSHNARLRKIVVQTNKLFFLFYYYLSSKPFSYRKKDRNLKIEKKNIQK